ncbi:putative Homeobox protein goosecoid-like 2 [Homarus americanus]|uniref:Putative Homeobox protein goosecoid-like 2 n=1 Tax=Homarus americanus TaxID=6706 RepID=A0A8J5MUF8_HOMAM|nr:putative Homeobox protein goosecoid-like 2 [Homarus americanus]
MRRAKETQEEVEVLGEVLVRRPAVLVSGALVLLGVIDCMVSLACVTISAREACGLYSKGEDNAQGLSEGHNRKERLYRWLGQQKTIFPIGSSSGPPRGVSSISQFVPLSSSDSSSSATPRKTLTDPSGVSSIPSSSSHRIHHQTATPPLATPSHISSSVKGGGSKVAPSSVPSILKPPSHPVTSGSHSLPQLTSKHHSSTQNYERRHSIHPHMQAAYPHLQHSLHMHHLHPHPHAHPHPHPHPHHISQKAHAHPHQYPQLPSSHPHHHPQLSHTPQHAAHPSLYYPHLVTPMMPHFPSDQDHHQQARTHKKKDSKKRRNKDGKKDKKKAKKSKELTDEQIERTYTGLDREIAEEFIDSTMEPGISIQRALNSTFDQDSF